MKRLFDVWNFVFKALPTLRQICIHIAIFPVLLSVQECHNRIRRDSVRDRILEGLERSLDVTIRIADVFLNIGLEGVG